jgi:alanyl-tRNA synthetase
VAGTLKATPAELSGRVVQVMDQLRSLEKEIAALKGRLAPPRATSRWAEWLMSAYHALAATRDGADASAARTMTSQGQAQDRGHRAGGGRQRKVQAAGVTSDSTGRIKAGELVNFVAQQAAAAASPTWQWPAAPMPAARCGPGLGAGWAAGRART